MKSKLIDNVPDIEFCHSARANEPDRMHSSKTKKTAIDDFDKTTLDASVDMKVVFDCARIIRHDIATSHKQQPWKFADSLAEQDPVPIKVIGDLYTVDSDRTEVITGVNT